MPIHLSSFMGGLGNQMFSITAIISLAYEHNTVFSFNKTQDLAPGISVSRVYYDIYNKLCKHIKYKDFDESLPQINYCTEQFKDININDKALLDTHTLVLEGLPMKYSIIHPSINILKEIFNKIKVEYIPDLIKPMITKLAIGIRTFSEEGYESEWSTGIDYYRKAIKYMSNNIDICSIDIYTDKPGSSEKLLVIIREYFQDRCTRINEYAGNRNGNTDVNHFFQMFDYDHYILCNSTYHYWPALLSVYNSNKIVTWPGDSECNWYLYIAAPEWVKL